MPSASRRKLLLSALTIILVSVISAYSLHQKITSIEQTLPLATLQQEREFTSLLLAVNQLENNLGLAINTRSNDSLLNLEYALANLTFLHSEKPGGEQVASYPGLGELHRDLDTAILHLSRTLEMGEAGDLNGPNLIQEWNQLSARLLAMSKRHFQQTIYNRSLQKQHLSSLNRGLLAGIALMAIGAFILIAVLFKNRRVINLLVQREQELQHKDDMIKEAIEAVTEGFVIYDKDDRFIMCNEAYRKLYALSADLFVAGNTFEHIIRVGAERGQYPAAIGNLDEWVKNRVRLHREADNFALQQQLEDGTWLQIIEHKTSSGYIAGNRVDITALKKIEAELRDSQANLEHQVIERSRALHESETQLRTIMDNAPMDIYLKDVDGRYLRVNRHFEQIWGITNDEVKGQLPSVVFSHDYADRAHAQDLQVLREKRPVEMVHTVLIKDELHHLNVTKFPIVDDGMLIGIGAVSYDNTVRMLAEEELRHNEIALRAAKDEAERASQAKSEFLTSMSHELRTPLHGIMSFAELGKNHIDQISKEKLAHYFKNIHTSGTRLLGLINDLLDISKFASGNMSLDYARHSLSDIWQLASQELESLIEGKSLKLEFIAPQNSTDCECDQLRILQVISNLLSNAIKFSPSGSTIRCEVRAAQLSRHGHGGQKRLLEALQFSITDEGVGVPESDLKLVFEKFTQSEKPDSDIQGTGLGLSICAEIIGLHQGRIWARNSPRGGAEFLFMIPTRQIEVPAAARTA